MKRPARKPRTTKSRRKAGKAAKRRKAPAPARRKRKAAKGATRKRTTRAKQQPRRPWQVAIVNGGQLVGVGGDDDTTTNVA